MDRITCNKLQTMTNVALAIFASSGISTGHAQSSASAGAKALEEVVVTAQRREQSLQDVSMSITAFSEKSLEDKAIEGAEDIQFSLPNVVIAASRPVVRGVGNNAASSTAEQGLGYHVNGVYLKFPQTGISEYFDISRIEVLRGPQGTLYGRNTTAGVINLYTQAPQAEWGGYLSTTIANYDTRRAHGAINIPISDNFRQRFSGIAHKREGFNKNIHTGNQIDGRDSWEVRSSSSFDFSESLTGDLVVSYLKEDSDRATRTKGLCTKDFENGCSPTALGFETPDVSQSIFQILNITLFQGTLFPIGDYFASADNPNDFRTVNIDMEPHTQTRQLGASLELNYSTENYQFTSLSGYYDTDIDISFDFDRFETDVLLFQPLTYRANGKDYITTRKIKSGRRDVTSAEQFTQEFRVLSDFQGSTNFLLGLFYYENEQFSNIKITHPAIAASQDRLLLDDEFEFFHYDGGPSTTESMAIFGELYYDWTADTRVTMGLRYTEDEKTDRGRLLFLILTDPEFSESKGSWSETTGKLTLEHAFNDNTMVFATYSRGYKAGGLNAGGGGSVTGLSSEPVPETFDPEYINAFEIGTKNTLLDGRLMANVGAFYYDYEGLQLGTVGETLSLTENADAEVYGAEAEFVFALTDQLRLEASLAYLQNDIEEAASFDTGDPDGDDPNSTQARDANGNPRTNDDGIIKDLSGNPLPGSPEWSVKLAAAYTFNIADQFGLTARIDHFTQAEYSISQFNKETDQLNGWSQTDFQLTLRPNFSDWKLRAYVKNVFDNDDLTFLDQQGPLVGRFRSANVLEPRLYGVEFSYHF